MNRTQRVCETSRTAFDRPGRVPTIRDHLGQRYRREPPRRERKASMDAWRPICLPFDTQGHRIASTWRPTDTDPFHADETRGCDESVASSPMQGGVAGPFRPWVHPHLCERCLGAIPAAVVFNRVALEAFGEAAAYSDHWYLTGDVRDLPAEYAYCGEPYRIFVRDDGAWRIVDAEVDGPPAEAVSWTDLIASSWKQYAHALDARYASRMAYEGRPVYPTLHGASIGMNLSAAAYVALERVGLDRARAHHATPSSRRAQAARALHHQRVLAGTAWRRGWAVSVAENGAPM